MEEYQIEISEETLKEVEAIYAASDKETVRVVLLDIINRYMNVEHFDPEISISK